MDSILNTIKKMLGIPDEYDVYDADIIAHINTVIFSLRQMGIRSDDHFVVTCELETWNDYLGDTRRFEAVKTYIYMRVKQVFDPSNSSAMTSAIDKQIEELEWRLSVEASEEET